MTTLSKINKALKAKGIDAEILSGKGYVYFAGPATTLWKSTMVCIPNVRMLSLDEGVDLYFEKLMENA